MGINIIRRLKNINDHVENILISTHEEWALEESISANKKLENLIKLLGGKIE